MMGIAEKNTNSISKRIVEKFKIGEAYPVSEIEGVLGYKPGGADRKGVLGGDKTDYIVLKITYQKVIEMNDKYNDHVFGRMLFWSGMKTRRFAERCVCDGKHDVFVFIRVTFGSDFLYYGRAIPTRIWNSCTDGVPSSVVFDMYEYAQSEWYKYTNKNVFSYSKADFRNDALNLWNNIAAVGNVSDSDLLVTRHIKPIVESTEKEINDPANSLVLTPNYDNLFYRGIISFSPKNGRIILPNDLSWRKQLEEMNITSSDELNTIPTGTDAYLSYHKNYIFGFYNCNHDWKYQ